jgi:carboxyl-terminal processing protease
MNDLKAKGIKGLIVDLRQNGGGSLYECEEIADALLGKQVIVYTQDRQGKKEYYYSDDRKLGLPIVVLVDGGSASASEILTGAIKDTKAGIIVGEKTFGKGIVQSVIALKDSTAIKLTTSQYFTPNGINIHGKGIEPDVTVKAGTPTPGSDKIDSVGDPQLKKAIEVMMGQIK